MTTRCICGAKADRFIDGQLLCKKCVPAVKPVQEDVILPITNSTTFIVEQLVEPVMHVDTYESEAREETVVIAKDADEIIMPEIPVSWDFNIPTTWSTDITLKEEI